MTKIELDIIRSIISILIILIISGFVLIQPYIEEAMFTNLRVFPEENKK